MEMLVLILFICTSWTALIHAQTHGPYRTVCYLAGWARNRQAPVTYNPEDIDTSLCTHVIYAFAFLDKTGQQIVTDDTSDLAMYRRLVAMKRQRPALKVMLAIGGWSMGSEEFSALVSSHQKMVTFANNAIQFLHEYNFDGMDIDWEYPADRGSPAADKQHFTDLLKTVYAAFDHDHRQTNRPKLLLSAAIAPSPYIIRQSYELPAISNYLDFINLMTYDQHGVWDSEVGHHSTLYSPTGDGTDSVDYNINFMRNTTVPPSKINMGIPFYGRTYALSDPSNTNLGAPIAGEGGPGPINGDRDTLAYYEVCKILTENAGSVTSGRLSGINAPYMVDGRRWTGYDDVTSIKEKVAYVMNHGLGGVMIWSIDMDDFQGICGQGHNPLLHAISQAYAGLVG